MQNVSEDKVAGFSEPTMLPRSAAERDDWQAQNRRWWEARPMSYESHNPIPFEPGTAAFFDEVDRRFFETAKPYLPWRVHPFEDLIDYESLKSKDVLEIGVGMGTHAELLARHARTFTGVDLTEAAVGMTTKRLALRGLPATVVRMDAEQLTLPTASIDFIWSWGVIHHSADTRKILEQMRRVLRPGGSATVMVYHRSWWRYWVVNALGRGLLQRRFFRGSSLHTITQEATDGAIARFYKAHEFAELCRGVFDVTGFRVVGQPSMALPLPSGALKEMVIRAVPDAGWRVLTNHLRGGTFLVVNLRPV